MRYDLSPFYRHSVGFDPLFQMLDSVTKLEDASGGYPPYDIEKTGDDTYRITMAVAGFGVGDLSIVAQDTSLAVTGRKQAKENEAANYLHRGIAARQFERRFQLADHMQVTGARLADGLLHIELKREVPQALRPRAIAIESGSTAQPALDTKKVN